MTTAQLVEQHGTQEAEPPTAGSREALLAAYGEVCRSYHAIDDFRAKLLGILPIASLAGILLIGTETVIATPREPSGRLIGFASFFAAAFTLALFLFEVRGILRCHHLITRGRDLEGALGVRGQFYVCAHQHELSVNSVSTAETVFNAKVAASAVYSLVFTAWMFLGLRFTFGIALIGCGLTASAIGGALAVGTYLVISKHIAA